MTVSKVFVLAAAVATVGLSGCAPILIGGAAVTSATVITDRRTTGSIAADVFGGVADAPGAAPFIVRLQVVGAEMARDVHGDVSAADDGDTVADGHAALQQVLKRKDVGRVDAGNVGHAGFLARGEQDPASAVVVLNPLRGGASVADDFDAELDELALLHLEKLRD